MYVQDFFGSNLLYEEYEVIFEFYNLAMNVFIVLELDLAVFSVL